MENEKSKSEIESEVRYILSLHAGKENAIGRWELVERVFGRDAAANCGNNNPFDREIREVIAKYRDVDFICSSSGQSGYWIARSMEDVQFIIDDYITRSRTMEAKARTLKERGIEKFGPQMDLFKLN